jgi:hypothetical protein
MRPLRLTVKLGAGESPQSFTSRLAAANRLSAREFCLDFGVHFQRAVDGDPVALATVAALGGVPADALTAHAFVRTGRLSYLHRGERLIRDALRRSRPRVCPACIAGDLESAPAVAPAVAAYGRAAWLIEAVRTCPVHGMSFVQIADDPSPSFFHDFAFHAAAAIGRLEELVDAAARREPSGLERYVLARLEGALAAPFLDAMPLYAAIKTCELVGAVAAFGRTPNLKRLTDDQWWQAGGAGFAVAAGGAPAIGVFLAELQRTYDYRRSGREGPQALFGRLYQWLEFGAEDTAYDPVRGVVGDHIRSHLPVGPGDIVFGKPVLRRRLHSIRTLSLETGLHPKRLRKILGAVGAVTNDQAGRSDQNTIFPSEGVRDALRRVKSALPLRGAGLHLNAPRVHIRLLAEQGFIRPLVAAKAFAAEDRYATEDLDYFLRRLLQDAHAVGKPKHNQFAIPAAAKRACCSAADIVRLILDRKLAWIGRLKGERGYLSVLVDVEEIRAKTRGPEHGGITQREMSKRLHTTDGVVRALVKGKHLKTFTARDPVNHCPTVLTCPESAEKFQREYVSLFVLAKERGKHFRAVLRELDAREIHAEFDPEKIGARFYRRDALPRGLNWGLTDITDIGEGESHVRCSDRDQGFRFRAGGGAERCRIPAPSDGAAARPRRHLSDEAGRGDCIVRTAEERAAHPADGAQPTCTTRRTPSGEKGCRTVPRGGSQHSRDFAPDGLPPHGQRPAAVQAGRKSSTRVSDRRAEAARVRGPAAQDGQGSRRRHRRS